MYNNYASLLLYRLHVVRAGYSLYSIVKLVAKCFPLVNRTVFVIFNVYCVDFLETETRCK